MRKGGRARPPPFAVYQLEAVRRHFAARHNRSGKGIRQNGESGTNKGKMNLQHFADRHGLQVKNYAIRGPRGEIIEAYAGWSYFQPDTGYRKFNPVTQAKQAIEAIGLQYTAPAEPIKEDRRAFVIMKKPDGWYVADKAGPFKTRELARMARERLKKRESERDR
jgi:hypothetical protein